MHPIQVAARRSGLTPDVIRAWERRYLAVDPQRSGTNRRLYSEDDIEKLFLLRQVTRAGRRIGDVAGMPLDELRELAQADQTAMARVGVSRPREEASATTERRLAECLAAVEELDAAALEAALGTASLELSGAALMDGLLEPLMRRIGERWRDGSMRVAQEHLATAIVRSFLGAQKAAAAQSGPAPELIVATPSGQRHELGALMVAVTATSDGWRPTYLGPDVPADEIASAALARQARAVALSLVYPADDPRVRDELRTLRSRLGPDVPVFVGGASAPGYAEAARQAGMRLVAGMGDLVAELRALRMTPAS